MQPFLYFYLAGQVINLSEESLLNTIKLDVVINKLIDYLPAPDGHWFCKKQRTCHDKGTKKLCILYSVLSNSGNIVHMVTPAIIIWIAHFPHIKKSSHFYS